MGIPMIMPAVKNSRIKEVIRKFDSGVIEAISAHTISSSNNQKATYKLIILEHKKKKKKQKMSNEDKTLSDLYKKEVRVEDKYYVFATTMKDSWIGGDPNRVAEFYKKRWGIETSYKCYEQLRPWTTCTLFCTHSTMVLSFCIV